MRTLLFSMLVCVCISSSAFAVDVGPCEPGGPVCSEGNCAGKTITVTVSSLTQNTSQVVASISGPPGGVSVNVQSVTNFRSADVFVCYGGCGMVVGPAPGNTWGQVGDCTDLYSTCGPC